MRASIPRAGARRLSAASGPYVDDNESALLEHEGERAGGRRVRMASVSCAAGIDGVVCE